MLCASVLLAFCFFPMIIGSTPDCEDAAFPTDKKIRELLYEKISAKMSDKSLSYDCEMEEAAQINLELFDYSGDNVGDLSPTSSGVAPTAATKFVDPDTAISAEESAEKAVESWSQKLSKISATKFGCVYAPKDHEGKLTQRLFGCVFA
ncbi:hypothetical protein ANCCAN_19202 [Ancylostoma caninum]|uniref:SCP domain-containing protein n=1 Tax=Ancylostoma caninum TaxID=29170 RepID=A0A368FRW9_ANCCA|nr:hypothetical protein ANCCAN_19202 [Ancylostoma caninum]